MLHFGLVPFPVRVTTLDIQVNHVQYFNFKGEYFVGSKEQKTLTFFLETKCMVESNFPADLQIHGWLEVSHFSKN